jgi:phosphatidylglycerol:prolipoprotein diacylglycerol transferase
VFPELLTLGPVTVYTYGVMLAAAYLLGLWLAMSRARSRGLDPNRTLDLGIAIIVSALVGAKLLLLVVDFDHFRRSPGELLTLVRAGGVFYGGLIAAVAVAFWFMRRHRMRLWPTCDVFAPGIALGHAVGRLGCLAAGCCYGRPTDVPWGITFTNPVAAANVGTPLGLPLHPTQLYESVAEGLILVLLLATEHRGRPFPGRTFWSYLLLYGVTRFVIEFFRGDDRGMVVNEISTSQFISLILVPLSVAMLFYLSRATSSAPAEASGRQPRRA